MTHDVLVGFTTGAENADDAISSVRLAFQMPVDTPNHYVFGTIPRETIDEHGSMSVLTIPDRSFVVFRGMSREQGYPLAKSIRDATNCGPIFAISDDAKIETFDEEAMRKAGWVRASEAEAPKDPAE